MEEIEALTNFHMTAVTRIQIDALAQMVSGLQDEFGRAVDEVFRFSLRRLIPIPGIYKPADFKSGIYVSEYVLFKLDDATGAIASMRAQCDEIESSYLDLLSEYVTKFGQSVQLFKEMLERLDRKASDPAFDYPKSEYDGDLLVYEDAVRRHWSVGDRLTGFRWTNE